MPTKPQAIRIQNEFQFYLIRFSGIVSRNSESKRSNVILLHLKPLENGTEIEQLLNTTINQGEKMNTNELEQKTEETTELTTKAELKSSAPIVRRLLNVIPIDIEKFLNELDAE